MEKGDAEQEVGIFPEEVGLILRGTVVGDGIGALKVLPGYLQMCP